MEHFRLSPTEEDKRILKDLVRLSIASRFTGHGPPTAPEPDSELLKRELGAFVTLKHGGNLRGCIGNLIGAGPLFQTVWNMAQAAAFDDPRFNPLVLAELDGLEIEISILGPIEPCPDPALVEVGLHGLIMRQGARFPAHDALGKTILVGGVPYEVIGVLEERKGQLMKDQTADRAIKVPYSTYRKHYPADDEHFIGAEAYAGYKDAAEDEIRGLLRRRRGVPFNKPDNFGMTTAEAIADQFRQIMSTVALMTIVVSSIGLLVGGVGVMNIMLMSVTERTHEIGVRKAIGARRGDVVRQFLTEAVVLTGLGGLAGVLVGVAAAATLPLLFPSMPTSVPIWAVFMAVLMAMSVGLFFGMYPAIKASRLDPVEALRYE